MTTVTVLIPVHKGGDQFPNWQKAGPVGVQATAPLSGSTGRRARANAPGSFQCAWIIRMAICSLLRSLRPPCQRGLPTSWVYAARGQNFLLNMLRLQAKGRTWYDFARRIFELRGVAASIAVIRTQEYPTVAARPRNLVLDCRKLARDFGLSIPGWERGLGLALAERR